jgi:hypothetical protein
MNLREAGVVLRAEVGDGLWRQRLRCVFVLVF